MEEHHRTATSTGIEIMQADPIERDESAFRGMPCLDPPCVPPFRNGLAGKGARNRPGGNDS
jgi:hypothetical protein